MHVSIREESDTTSKRFKVNILSFLGAISLAAADTIW